MYYKFKIKCFLKIKKRIASARVSEDKIDFKRGKQHYVPICLLIHCSDKEMESKTKSLSSLTIQIL